MLSKLRTCPRRAPRLHCTTIGILFRICLNASDRRLRLCAWFAGGALRWTFVGVSREHLSRSQEGLDLVARAHELRIIRTLWLRVCWGHSWDRVAWGTGYRSLAGLHKLFQRVHGIGLRSADQLDPLSLAVEWELAVKSDLRLVIESHRVAG